MGIASRSSLALALGLALVVGNIPWVSGQSTPAVTDGREWLRPPALKAGDTIALVAPAAPVDIGALRAYAQDLEKSGVTVLIPKNIERKSGYLAGTDEERAAELNAMIRDPRVQAIFACRGGYGLTRILDRIDYAALRQNPKIITGYSDLTALHLAVARKARVITFHAPMVTRTFWHQDRDEFSFAAKSFRRARWADQYGKGKAGYPIAVPDAERPLRLNAGKARGASSVATCR